VPSPADPFLFQDPRFLGSARDLEAAGLDEIERLAGVDAEPPQPLHRPTRQAAHQLGGAEHRRVAGSPGRGLGGDLMTVQQGDAPAAATGQKVRGRGAEASRSDHDDVRFSEHRSSPRSPQHCTLTASP